MNEIKSVFITAKCSDLCTVTFKDKEGNEVAEIDGYVPEWMPENHYGDYVELEIDVKTGQILNWSHPTKSQLKKSIESN